ncbi:MAG: hypothetical protein MUF87_15100 [Anaerolineae bacterium]|jgi:hypothetical protein|nr:hypothetical protein [Anaerolineae bacterium]
MQIRAVVDIGGEPLLILLALAYTWLVALDSQAVAQDLVRRLGCLFREGLRFLAEIRRRSIVGLTFRFISDRRLTGKQILSHTHVLSKARVGVNGSFAVLPLWFKTFRGNVTPVFNQSGACQSD